MEGTLITSSSTLERKTISPIASSDKLDAESKEENKCTVDETKPLKQIIPMAVENVSEASSDHGGCEASTVKSPMMSPVRPADGVVVNNIRTNNVCRLNLHGVSIVALTIDGKDRLCLAQISNTLLKEYSYNEIHNRRVALGITCVQCTPVQLEILRRAGAMPASSRRCGMITMREAERLVKSFLEDNAPPQLPEDFAFSVKHECGWGCHGQFIPSRYNSSRAKCLKCTYCNMYFSPNKFIFHYHRTSDSSYRHPDAANFNSWRRHLYLSDPDASDDLTHAWEDVKAMFNGGIRKRVHISSSSHHNSNSSSTHKTISPSNPPEKRPKLEQKSPQCSQPFNNENFAKYKYPTPLNGPTGEFFPPRPRLQLQMSPNYPVGMPEEAPKVFPGPGGTWSPSREALYHPPYEMIWARHLGLTAPESSFALGPDQYNKNTAFPNEERCQGQMRLPISPRRESVPVATKDNTVESRMNQEPSGFKLYRPFDNVIEKSHLSAFKPVITTHNLSPVVPIDFSMNKDNQNQNDEREIENGEVGEYAEDQESESDEEVLDVDTVDDFSNEPINLSDVSCNTERTPGQSVIKTTAKRRHSSDDSQSITATLDKKICKLLDETKNIQTKFERVENESDDALNNNHETSDEKLEMEEIKNEKDKEQLQERLRREMAARKQLQEQYKTIKDNFQEQVEIELKHREEIAKQLHSVRETLFKEIERERTARFSLQEKLKEAQDTLHNFSCKMIAMRQCAHCRFSESLLPR